MTDPSPLRYHCADCHYRAAAPGDCPRCEDEPLLDLADEEVRLMLAQQDDATKWRHAGKVIGAAAGAAIPLTMLIMTAAEWIGIGRPNLIQVMFGSGLGVVFLLFKLWRPKYGMPELDARELDALQSSS